MSKLGRNKYKLSFLRGNIMLTRLIFPVVLNGNNYYLSEDLGGPAVSTAVPTALDEQKVPVRFSIAPIWK